MILQRRQSVPVRNPRSVKSVCVALGLMLLTGLPSGLMAQSAFVQVIHNAADPTVFGIDVYFNGERPSETDDLLFGLSAASPFIEIPAGETDIGVSKNASFSVADTLINKRVTLEADQYYIVFVAGVTNPDDVLPNPDGKDVGLQIIVKEQARKVANAEGTVDILLMNGVSDSPRIDIRELTGAVPIFAAVPFSEVSNYTTITPVDFDIGLTWTDLSSVLLESFRLQLSRYAGQAVTLVFSGFRSPNQNCQMAGCPDQEVLLVTNEGGVVSLDPTDPGPFVAGLQFIHASADRDIRRIDLYIDGQKLHEDLPVNGALPFLGVFSGQAIELGIAHESSVTALDTLKSFSVSLEAGNNYTVALVGVLETHEHEFASNPDGRDIGLQLTIAGEARKELVQPFGAEYRILHALTDVGRMDVHDNQGNRVAGGLDFGEFSEYNETTTPTLPLHFSPRKAPAHLIGRFPVRFSSFGQPVTLILTGFKDKFSNNLGPVVKLHAVYASGLARETVPDKTSNETARIQFIHASPDPDLTQVDLYFQDELLHDNFAFFRGGAYITVLADSVAEIGVAPPLSTSSAEVVYSLPIQLTAHETYTGVVAGLATPEIFQPNPDGLPTSLEIFVSPGAREESTSPPNTEFRVVYASPDSPTADIYVDNHAVVLESAAYGSASGYTSLPSDGSSYEGEIGYHLVYQPAGERAFATSIIDLNSIGQRAVTVVVTGFLDSDANNGAQDLSAMLVFADGYTPNVSQTVIVDTEDEAPVAVESFRVVSTYPNPARSTASIIVDMPRTAAVDVELFDVTGRKVLSNTGLAVTAGPGRRIGIDLGSLPTGLYNVRIKTNGNGKSETTQTQLIRIK